MLNSHAIGRYICAPPYPTLYRWILVVTSASEDCGRLTVILQTNSDSARNEQVKTSVCRVNFDGSSANVTLFSSRKIFLFWKVFGWLRLQGCKSGRAFPVGTGSGLSLSKCFGTISGLCTSSVAPGSLLNLAPLNKAPTPKLKYGTI